MDRTVNNGGKASHVTVIGARKDGDKQYFYNGETNNTDPEVRKEEPQCMELDNGVDPDARKKPVGERGEWANQAEFTLSCVGFAVGLANFWRFPYLCMRNGGGAFLVPYVTLLALVGLPIYALEMILGQFSSSGVINTWRITPLSAGLGVSSTVVSWLLTIYYNIIMVWALFYLGMSLRKEIPWQDCDNWWNSPNCSDTARTLLPNSTISHLNISDSTPVDEFWSKRTLDISSGLEDIGPVRWELALCLFVICLALFLCLFKGVQSFGKASYVTALVPYALLFVFLVRSAMLPGSFTGIKLYIIPEWGNVLQFKVWCEACLQLMFSLGLGLGGIITFSSYNSFHVSCVRASIITCAACGFTSFFAGFVVFSVIGYLMHITQLPLDQVVKQGPSLAFSVYPEVILHLAAPQLWSVLFFSVLIILGMGCQVGNYEAVITGLADRFPSLQRRHRTVFVAAMMAFCFLLGLPFTTRGGMYLFLLFDWYVTPLPLLMIVVCECWVISYVYGIGRFYRDAKFMLSHVSYFWVVCWCVICPVITLMLLVISILKLSPPSYGDYTFPQWGIGLGWALAMAAIIPIPLYAVVTFFKTQGSIAERLVSVLSPSVDWGPNLPKHKASYDLLSKRTTWIQRMDIREPHGHDAMFNTNPEKNTNEFDQMLQKC